MAGYCTSVRLYFPEGYPIRTIKYVENISHVGLWGILWASI